MALDIEEKDIRQLGSEDLVRLLKKLLHLEALENGIPQSSASVPLQITVGDGGEDGRIEWTGGPDETDYIPNRLTMFQSKAENMAPQKCNHEICKNGKIKERILEIINKEGVYIIFCSHGFPQEKIEKRKIKMIEAFTSNGYAQSVKEHLFFYDGNKIADWTNKFPLAQTFVRKCTGKCDMSGLQTWLQWNKEESPLNYYTNEILSGHIESIRKTFNHTKPRPVRITGLSGLGKTRLALEAFRPPEKSNPMQQGLSDSVIYYVADSDSVNIANFICENRRATVTFVIDECDLELHKKLAKQVSAQDSNSK